jgi:hypothetical protein
VTSRVTRESVAGMRSPLLQPVVALVAWSMVMWTWMYITRIPAISRARMKLDPFAPRG